MDFSLLALLIRGYNPLFPRPAFNFSLVNVPVGAILYFINDEAVTGTVINDKEVEFEDFTTSLSDAARTMLHRLGGKLTAAHVPRYWIYKNETLTELRFRMKEKDDSDR